jgi:hypothetical protein
MNRKMVHRGTAVIAALALALGPAGTALAKPSDDPSSPNVQHPQVQSFDVVDVPAAPTTPHASGGGSTWPYLAIGGGAVGIALVGAGGAVAASQRRHRRTERRSPTIAA